MNRFTVFAPAAALALGLAGCERPGGSEAGRGIRLEGRAWYEDSTPAPGVEVRLRPRRHLPAAPLLRIGKDTVTDAAGRFAFEGLDTGDYAVELRAGEETGAVLYEHLGGATGVVTVEDTLRATAFLEGVVRGDGAGLPLAGAEVAVLGLDFRSPPTDSAGRFHFDALPPGMLSLRVIPPSAAYDSLEVPGVALRPGVPATLDLRLRSRLD